VPKQIRPGVGLKVKHWWQRWKQAWRLLRQVTGDDAYDRYLAHQTHHHHGEQPLTRAEFYRQQLDRRWRGVNRCC
jgi:uncharacterized short protein YbdD (DUF466 family)